MAARRPVSRCSIAALCILVGIATLAQVSLARGESPPPTDTHPVVPESPAADPSGVTGAEAPGGTLDALMFYVVAMAAAVSALGVCVSQNVVRMAVWLFCALGAVGLLYFLLAATFLGAIQFIVYVGGTLILLIFGVMLTSKSPWVRFDTPLVERVAAGVVCVALLIALAAVYARTPWPGAVETPTGGVSVEELGRALLTTYLVPFEAAGVLLMIVMVGAAHLARQEKRR
jgi:NADH:ubiquinone oxidoreductase subunit 6 (subunit J)